MTEAEARRRVREVPCHLSGMSFTKASEAFEKIKGSTVSKKAPTVSKRASPITKWLPETINYVFYFCDLFVANWQDDGPRTGTIGTVFFPETERGTGTVGTVFQKPKPEAEPRLSTTTLLEYREVLSPKKPSEPKTGTTRTVPCTNRNWTEPNCGHLEMRSVFVTLSIFYGKFLSPRLSLFSKVNFKSARRIPFKTRLKIAF